MTSSRRPGEAWIATIWRGSSAYVREVADQKTAALRMSLDAVERQEMPFAGQSGGISAGQGMGEVPGGEGSALGDPAGDRRTRTADRAPDRSGLPPEGGLAERLAEARRRAAAHADHGTPRAPRADRMEH